jgi:antitoxin PrlF
MPRRAAVDLANALHRKVLANPGAASEDGEILEIPRHHRARPMTVPAAIWKMLAPGKRDQVVFRGLADGTVVIAKKEPQVEDGDPVIGKFLEFLARDMAKEPARIRPVPRSLISRGKALVKGVRVDLDAPLPDDEA